MREREFIKILKTKKKEKHINKHTLSTYLYMYEVKYIYINEISYSAKQFFRTIHALLEAFYV